MKKLTRIVIIEKINTTKENRFSFTSKGLHESKIFIESIGGWDEAFKKTGYVKPWFSASTAFYLSKANEIWKNLK
jgi:hypothetical protein